MDFEWPEAAVQTYDRVLTATRAWPEPFAERPFTREQWQGCADAGLTGLSVPAEFGGGGLGFLGTARAAEAFGSGYQDFGLVFSVMAHLLACTMPIAEFGTPALRNRLLPGLCSGELIGANAVTEQSAGSDVTAVRTTAVRDGDGYRLTGTKTYVSNGPVADVFVVYGSTDPAMRHLGVTGFVVDRRAEGLSVGEPFDKLGLRSCPGSSVTLTDCWVPDEQVLGKPGQGGAIFQASMRWERTCLFGAYLGQAARVLDRSVEHARTRRQFGRRIGANQAVSHRLATLHLKLESARLLLYRACWRLDRGEPATADVAMAKLAASEAAVEISLAAVHLFGGAGVRTDAGIERELRNAVPSTIFSGTSEMQLEQIAGELGL
jgi:alkylation response protein AidB-like acyl-CoA dehydrogenase